MLTRTSRIRAELREGTVVGAPLLEAAKRESITWPCFFDGGGTDGPIATKWGVTGWPTIFVIDAKGIIRYRDVREAEMDEAVDALLAEMKKPL